MWLCDYDKENLSLWRDEFGVPVSYLYSCRNYVKVIWFNATFIFFIYLVKLCSQLSHKRSGKVSSDYQNFLKQIENFKHLKLFF